MRGRRWELLSRGRHWQLHGVLQLGIPLGCGLFQLSSETWIIWTAVGMGWEMNRIVVTCVVGCFLLPAFLVNHSFVFASSQFGSDNSVQTMAGLLF